ncbi:hypothetical protein ACFQ6C_26335 [Streptomyces sp. NPDC056454]|uniref:hypothetical protein n=1 Tax=Streptomyces sp. NPDC056454 TaxID=3345823 RepID=UPI0036CBB7B4
MTKPERRLLIKSVALVALGITVIVVSAFAIRWATADLRGEASKREQTIANGAFRIATYEEFYDLCAAVQTSEQQLKALRTELDGKPSPDREERIRSSITAVTASRAESITTYNSKATQEHRTAFQDARLPYTLDITAKETTCAA